MKNEDVARGMTERIIEKLSCYNIDESKWQNYKMLQIEYKTREKRMSQAKKSVGLIIDSEEAEKGWGRYWSI